MRRRGYRLMAAFLVVLLVISGLPENLGKNVEVPEEVKAETTLQNPRIVSDSYMRSGQIVTWDCIWLGFYPQTEIVDKPETSGCYGKGWEKESDYDVNPSLYTTLQNEEEWDSNGDCIIDGVKYRKIKESDTTNSASGDEYYSWNTNDNYHYFRYEKIKWRVLEIRGDKALLMSDKVIDNQMYDNQNEKVTWLTCSLRKWLNQQFIRSAFSENESNILLNVNANYDNARFVNNSATVTEYDKVFILSRSDMSGSTEANTYGFVDDMTYDEARKCKSTAFSKAMGAIAHRGWDYNCYYWLLFGENDSRKNTDLDLIDFVYPGGDIDGALRDVDNTITGVRPSLMIDLSNADTWFYAGTVCSDGTVNEIGGGSSSITTNYLPSINGWGDYNKAYGGKIKTVEDEVYWRVFESNNWKNHVLRNVPGKMMKEVIDVTSGICQGLAVSSALTLLKQPALKKWTFECEGNSFYLEKPSDVLSDSMYLEMRNSDFDLNFSQWLQALQIWQASVEGATMKKRNKELGLQEIINRTKEFEKTNQNPIVITIEGENSKGKKCAHTVFPYAVKEHNNNGVLEYNIYIYDCNRIEGRDDPYLLIKDNNGQLLWSYEMWNGQDDAERWYWGSGKKYANISFYDNLESMDDTFNSKHYLNASNENVLLIDNNSSVDISDNGGLKEVVISGNSDNANYYYVDPDSPTIISNASTDYSVVLADSESDVEIQTGKDTDMTFSNKNNRLAIELSSDKGNDTNILLTENRGEKQTNIKTTSSDNSIIDIKEEEEGFNIIGAENIEISVPGSDTSVNCNVNKDNEYRVVNYDGHIKLQLKDPESNEYTDVIETGKCGEDVIWKLNEDGVLIISGKGPMWDYQSSSDEHKTNPWAKNDSVKTILLEEGITHIGERAFANCRNVREIQLPNSIKNIGRFACSTCKNLQAVTIPEGIKKLDGTFAFCENLSEVNLPNSLREIGDSTFICCNLNSIDIPQNVISIGENAFGGPLREIVIPKSVTSIGKGAFSEIETLENVKVNGSISTISDDLFRGCIGLKEISIADGPQKIGNQAFYGCTALERIVIPNSVTTIEQSAFEKCSSLKELLFSSKLKTINAEAFDECSSLEEVTLPKSTELIKSYAFGSCPNIKTVTINGDQTVIEDNAFFSRVEMGYFGENRKYYYNDAMVVSAPKGSPAEQYAIKYGFLFEELKGGDGDGSNNVGEGSSEKPVKISSISFTGKPSQVTSGAEVQLTATVLPKNATNKTLKWSSSNTKVATVTQKGLVTIKSKVGGKTVTIKAAATDGSAKTASWKFTVKKDPIKVSSVKVTGISKKIANGRKFTLKAMVLPKTATNKKLKWTSSNTKYAKVNEKGVVKVNKKAGGKKVTIKATTKDGSKRAGAWKIQIMKGAVKKITVKGYKKTLKAGKTMKLKAVVKATKGKPVNKKLKWTSLNPKYATVTQTGKVKAKTAGKGKTVKIKVESTDGTNKSITKKIRIK